MDNRITVKKAAELMQVSEQFIRVGLQQNRIPIGFAIKNKSKWWYFISKEKFEKETGIKVE